LLRSHGAFVCPAELEGMANLEYTFNIRSVSDHEIRTLELARDVDCCPRDASRGVRRRGQPQAYATADAALSAHTPRRHQALQAHIAGGRS
jgi:hypothetical protein